MKRRNASAASSKPSAASERTRERPSRAPTSTGSPTCVRRPDSGSDVVAAAAIAPVSGLVSALRTSAERSTPSRSVPGSVARRAQSRHQAMVSSSRSSSTARRRRSRAVGAVDRVRRHVAHLEPDALARRDREARRERVVAAPIGAGLAGDEQGVVARQRVVRAAGGVVEPRGGGPVVEARHDVRLELHLAVEALDDAHELSPRAPGRLAVDGEEVEHAGAARRGPPGRAEHERAVDVAALGLRRGARRAPGRGARRGGRRAGGRTRCPNPGASSSTSRSSRRGARARRCARRRSARSRRCPLRRPWPLASRSGRSSTPLRPACAAEVPTLTRLGRIVGNVRLARGGEWECPLSVARHPARLRSRAGPLPAGCRCRVRRRPRRPCVRARALPGAPGRAPRPTREHNAVEAAIALVLAAVVAVLVVVTFGADARGEGAGAGGLPRRRGRVQVGLAVHLPVAAGRRRPHGPGPPAGTARPGRVQVAVRPEHARHRRMPSGSPTCATSATPGRADARFDLRFAASTVAGVGRCAQYCGLQHSDMVFTVDAWLRRASRRGSRQSGRRA